VCCALKACLGVRMLSWWHVQCFDQQSTVDMQESICLVPFYYVLLVYTRQEIIFISTDEPNLLAAVMAAASVSFKFHIL
jgi:hypothetical protein